VKNVTYSMRMKRGQGDVSSGVWSINLAILKLHGMLSIKDDWSSRKKQLRAHTVGL
jgi:hypothetical protein